MSVIGIHGSSDNRTFVSNSGAILASGTLLDVHTDQLAFLKVSKKGTGLPDQAQLKPTLQSAPVFKLAVGRAPYEAQEGLQTSDYSPLQSVITREIKGRDIIKWRGQKANPQSQTEIWTVGYDGVDASKRLHGAIDYNELIFSFRLWGGPINKYSGGKPFLVQQFHISKGCIDKCLNVCDTNPGLADELIADELLAKWNAREYGNVPISRFVRVSKLRKSADADTPITGLVTSTQYSVSVCDDGSAGALGAVQNQYSGLQVLRSDRTGAISTYQVWKQTSGAPAPYVATLPVALAVCGTCPSGYTLTPSADVYSIERVLAPTTDLSTDAAKQTYANTIGTAYAAASRQVTGVAGGGGTGYTNGTHPLVFAGGGGSGAEGYVVVTGGIVGTPVVTKGGQNYTSAPTVTVPAAGAGTGATYTASISAAATATSTFVYASNGKAVVNVSFPATVQALTPQASDSFVGVNTASQYCTPPAGTSISWTTGITRQRAPKQWMLTLEDTVCGNTRLSEVQAAYPDLVVSEEGAANDCTRVYLTTNYSQPLTPEECVEENYIFTKPDAFFDGGDWLPFVDPLVNPVCTTEDEDQPCVAAGLKFETASFVKHTGECLYGYYQWGREDVDPVYMEISVHNGDFTTSPCYKTDQVVTKLRETKFATGQGAFIKESERSTLQQYGFYWSTNPAYNQAYGVYFNAKEKLWYDTYHLTVAHKDGLHGNLGHEGRSRHMTYTFAFPAGQGKTFETLINGYVLSLDSDSEDLQPVIL